MRFAAKPVKLKLLILPILLTIAVAVAAWFALHRPSYGDGSTLFVSVTHKAGIHYRWTIRTPGPANILETIGNGCAFFDYDNDGNLDILLVGPRLVLYKGDGHGHFSDVTHQMGLDRFSGHFLGCAVGDYDNDGYDDIYISGYRAALLLHNEKGTGFTDVTKEAGLKPQPWGTSCAWGDIDNDGKLDLYVCNYVDFGPGSRLLCTSDKADGSGEVATSCGPAQYKPLKGVLYHNLGGGKFEDVTAQWGADKATGKALAVAFADYNGSGRQSLYLANDRMSGDLLLNTGRRFRNVGVESGTAYPNDVVRAGMGVDWDDYDNDGKLDMTIADFQGEKKSVYRNQGGGLFEDRCVELGVAEPAYHYLSFGVKWFDYNNDGWPDLVFANGYIEDNVKLIHPNDDYRQTILLLRNDVGRHFTDMTYQAGPDVLLPLVGRGLATGDYDNDGREDLLVVDSDGEPLLLHNQSKKAGHWLSLSLVGTRSSRDGYGALVRVTAGSLTQVRLCHADGSYMSSSDKRVHVGLGSATVVQSLRVDWPSGHSDRFKDVPADRVLVIHEGDKTIK